MKASDSTYNLDIALRKVPIIGPQRGLRSPIKVVRGSARERAEPLPDDRPAAPSEDESPKGDLSDLARQLLFAACDDPEAYIGRLKEGNIFKIQANGRQFVPPGDTAATARWDAAFQELLDAKYVRDAGCHGRLFQISPEGFAWLKGRGKSPVGYIAELGSV
jgi:hypothetical protein